MKMLVAAVGVIVPSTIRLNHQRQTATLTLKVDDSDRYYVTSVGLEQYELMVRMQKQPGPLRLVVLGYGFTFIGKRCQQHHVGIEPIFVVNPDHYELNTLQDIAAQWFTASLSSLVKSPNGIAKHRRNRIETKELF